MQYKKYLTVTLPDGSKKKLQIYGKTEKEAARKRDRLRAEYDAGLLVFGPKTTVAQYAGAFAEELKNADSRSRLQRLIVDQIGHLRLEDVRATQIRAIFRILEGKSASSVSKGVALVRRFFRQAVADGLILRDPCLQVPRPAAKEFIGRRSMTEQEEALFRQVLAERIHDGKHAYDVAWGLMYACGLRPGEARALQRAHVRLGEDPTVQVIQACKSKTKQIGSPKTAAGVREIPIPAWFVPLLRAGMAADSLFVAPGDGGEVMTSQCMRRRWESFYHAMQRAAGAKTYRGRILASPIGQELDPYCLRHTYCTNLAYAGVPEVVAMRWMGHTDPNMVRKVYADAANTKLIRRSVELLNAVTPL